MRKEQKEQVNKYVELMQEAHQKIINNLMAQDYAVCLDMLEECQQGAIRIGELIEEAEGEGFGTVGILEEYCEVIYNIHRQLCVGEEINISGIQKVLKKFALRMENSVNNDIRVRKEVVFLPYKVAMWDSLESVWEAASKDPEYDVYVVPIPYFDKNPDDSLGNMHYEGNEYPDNVPITDYRSYNIEKRRPDIIFIHNPFDEFNAITSIHPDFYSQKIWQWTNMLVYIPYFVAELGIPENLLLLPGTMYAKKVIVATEEDKKAYIEKFEAWIKEKGMVNGYEKYMPDWREKFLVIGSPKYDKVLSTKRDDSKLPEKWRMKIYNENGDRKKVLFYNISITALLESDNVIKKIEDTMNIISKRDDVVMWWRPHPLYENTLRNLKPYLLQRYKEMVERYIKSEIGIFDDTTDLNRAIAESDMYYGDTSSVMYLFQKVGKPVLIQNTEITCN